MNKGETVDDFIRNFVPKENRERIAFELKNQKNRSKFTARLNHEWDTMLNMKLVTRIPSRITDDYEFSKKELEIKDNELCYIISNYEDVDGKTEEFNTAFDAVYGRGLGSLIIIASGDKFYLETEIVPGKQNRFIGKFN